MKITTPAHLSHLHIHSEPPGDVAPFVPRNALNSAEPISATSTHSHLVPRTRSRYCFPRAGSYLVRRAGPCGVWGGPPDSACGDGVWGVSPRRRAAEDQGTRAPRHQTMKGAEDQGMRGPRDRRTKGPGDQGEDQGTKGPGQREQRTKRSGNQQARTKGVGNKCSIDRIQFSF